MTKRETTFIRKGILCALLCLGAWMQPHASEHPRIYVSDADKAAVRAKIERQEWARNACTQLKEKLNPYVERHRTDPGWIVSRLAMYWKEGEHYTQCYLKNENWERGEGNAPVPTVRMPGMRTWNRYVNVPLEERTPYNETGDMWGLSRTDPSAPKQLIPYKESGHMIRANNVEILTLAEEAAFLYWLTEEERYARFAADIFNTWLAGTYYMNPILDPEESSKGKGGYEPGGICGYYDYEQIHDELAMHAAVIYDFAHDYLLRHPHPHWKQTGQELDEVAGCVFKRFIDIGFVRGGKNGNWNVNGWNMMLLPILALEENDRYADGKGRSHYLHYLTTESTPYHDAIPDILKSYDPVTGLWPESPGYSFGTISILFDFSLLLKRCGIDLIADNPMMRKAAFAVFPWMDERGNLIVFGDSRGGPADFGTFERLLAYYTESGDTDNRMRIGAAIQTGIAAGSYRRERAGWRGLCTFAELPVTDGQPQAERSSYSPHHRLVTMKSEPDKENLMAVLYGGRDGYHLTANGLALQLYGFGYALAPDAAGYESYWSADKAYHQSPTGSNTILPGYTEGDIVLHALEPSVEEGAFTADCSLNPFINVCDMEAGEKRRVTAMVKTAPDKGYYVDIFRSDLPDNDYLFHNVGTSLTVMDTCGKELPTERTEHLAHPYHEGYGWFKNIRMANSDADIHAVWEIASGEQPLSMHAWMPGGPAREIYCMEAPYTTLRQGLTPDNASAAPSVTPTLLVRQEHCNAWASPYIAVFQPTKGEASVKSVQKLKADGEQVVLCIVSENGRTDYFFSATDPESACNEKTMQCCGQFGMVTEGTDGIEQLYLIEGRKIAAGDCSIEAEAPVSASVYKKEGRWHYSSTGRIRVKRGTGCYDLPPGYGMPLP